MQTVLNLIFKFSQKRLKNKINKSIGFRLRTKNSINFKKEKSHKPMKWKKTTNEPLNKKTHCMKSFQKFKRSPIKSILKKSKNIRIPSKNFANKIKLSNKH
jgi:hypothetical protein